jgi:hypothetical protein
MDTIGISSMGIGKVFVGPTGAEISGKFIMTNPTGISSLTFNVDPNQEYPITWTYPKTFGDTDDVLNISNDGSLKWSEQIKPGISNIVYVAINPTNLQFSTITTAMESITDASSIKPYIIIIGPGIYIEENITVKSWVTVSGVNSNSVCIQSNTNTNPVFRMLDNSSLWYLSLKALSGGGTPLIITSDQTNINLTFIDLNSSTEGINIGPSSTENVNIILNNIVSENITTNVLKIDGSGTNIINVYLLSFLFKTTGSATAIILNSFNARLNIQAGTIEGPIGNGTGINVFGGAILTVSGITIRNYNTGITDTGGGSGTNMLIDFVNFDTISGYSLSVTNVLTIGHFYGCIDRVSVNIDNMSAFFIANNPNNILYVYKKGGSFTSVSAAIIFINSQITQPTLENPYIIIVGPGDFIDIPFTIPRYVEIKGQGQEFTKLIPSDLTTTFIRVGQDNTISNIAIEGPTTFGNTIIFQGGPTTLTNGAFFIRNVAFRNSANAWVRMINPVANTLTTAIFENITGTGDYIVGFELDYTDSGAGPGGLGNVLNIYSSTMGNRSPLLSHDIFFLKTINGTSSNSNIVTIRNLLFTDKGLSNNLNGIDISDGATISILGTFFENNKSVITVNNSGIPVILNASSLSMLGTTTSAINISNPNTSGSIQGTLETSLVTQLPGENLLLDITDPYTGSVTISGSLVQGGMVSQLTNISESIQQGSNLGVISGGVLTNTTLLNIQITSGSGYLKVTGFLKYVTWNQQTSTLSGNTSNYIYIDNVGTLKTNISEPNNSTNIIIGFARTNATTISFFQQISSQANNTTQLLDNTSRDTFGPIYTSGSIVSNGTSDRSLNVTSGKYFYGTHKYTPTGALPITIVGYFGNSSTINLFTQLSTPFQYDNSGTLTSLLVSEFTKHILYVVNDGISEKYLFVFGQNTFSSQILAENGPLPIPPSFISGNVAQISSIVVQGTQSSFTSLQDIRPVVSFKSSSVGMTPTDHQTLTNRATDDAHSQYLLKNGTDTMTGNLDLGNNNIIDVNLYNGVTITDHHSRHEPGGEDPIMTAIAVSIGIANSEGTANSFSRSNHVHNHDNQTNQLHHAIATGSLNGFMSAVDKTILDTASSTPVNNNLIKYNAFGDVTSYNTIIKTTGTGDGQQNELRLESNNSNYVAINTINTLESTFTITLPPNIGTNGYILSTNGASPALTKWIPPPFVPSIIQRRTTTSQNLNNNSQSLINWDITDIQDVGTYTIASTTTIQILTTGRYEIYLNMVVDGTSSGNIITKIQKNGVNVPGSGNCSIPLYGFFGRTTQNSGSFQTILNINANDVISTSTKRNSNFGTISAISGESILIIKSV